MWAASWHRGVKRWAGWVLLCVLGALITLETHTTVGSNTPLVIFEGRGWGHSFAHLVAHIAHCSAAELSSGATKMDSFHFLLKFNGQDSGSVLIFPSSRHHSSALFYQIVLPSSSVRLNAVLFTLNSLVWITQATNKTQFSERLSLSPPCLPFSGIFPSHLAWPLLPFLSVTDWLETMKAIRILFLLCQMS